VSIHKSVDAGVAVEVVRLIRAKETATMMPYCSLLLCCLFLLVVTFSI
jgi:hypothetical protein